MGGTPRSTINVLALDRNWSVNEYCIFTRTCMCSTPVSLTVATQRVEGILVHLRCALQVLVLLARLGVLKPLTACARP